MATFHNGGYTRFISQFLYKEGHLSYYEFYDALFHYFKEKKDTLTGGILNRIIRLQKDYIEGDNVTVYGKVESQADMLRDLRPYSSPAKVWWTHDWSWLKINEQIDAFYDEMKAFVKTLNIEISKTVLDDIFMFQRDVMLKVDYDPKTGKKGSYHHNWVSYFAKEKSLQNGGHEVVFKDEAMGVQSHHVLKKNDLTEFALAACGNYYPEGRHRRFFHQFDKMEVI